MSPRYDQSDTATLDAEVRASLCREAVRATAEAEREECAALCDQLARDHGSLGAVATLCALNIRARGNVRLP